MFKRTKGYLLLTLLVLTGLAGRLHSNTLSGKERRALITELKSAKDRFNLSVDNLTAKQIGYRPAKNTASIKELTEKMESAQHELWLQTKSILAQKKIDANLPATADEAFTNIGSTTNLPAHFVHPHQTFEEVAQHVTADRNEMIRYLKTTTEDVRGHKVQSAFGTMDAYQSMLLATSLVRYYQEQIDLVKQQPGFPK